MLRPLATDTATDTLPVSLRHVLPPLLQATATPACTSTSTWSATTVRSRTRVARGEAAHVRLLAGVPSTLPAALPCPKRHTPPIPTLTHLLPAPLLLLPPPPALAQAGLGTARRLTLPTSPAPCW